MQYCLRPLHMSSRKQKHESITSQHDETGDRTIYTGRKCRSVAGIDGRGEKDGGVQQSDQHTGNTEEGKPHAF